MAQHLENKGVLQGRIFQCLIASAHPAMASVQPVPDQWVLAEPGATAVPLDRYWTMLGDPLVDRLERAGRSRNTSRRKRNSFAGRPRASALEAPVGSKEPI